MISRFKTVLIKLTFILISFFVTTSGNSARIYFNDIFKGTGLSYAEQTNSISSIQSITGTGFTFTSTDPADVTFRLTGNNVAGTLSYVNASGVKQSIVGQVSRQDKNGNTTIGLYFYTTTNEAYLLVIPGVTSYSSNTDVSTSSDPILAVMNDVLTAQNSQPKIIVNDVTVSNADSYAVFTISLSSAANANISFTPTLTAVTATLNSDYTSSMQYYNGSSWVNISSTVSITQGTTSLQIRVPILNGGGTTNRTFNINTGAITGGNILNSDGAYGVGTITPTPSITVSNNLKTFSTCSGCTVNPQSFTVSGSNLTANITLTAPTNVVLSATSNGTYSSTLTLTQSSGTITTTSVFVKLTSNSTSISSGVITASSTNATSKTISVTTNADNALNFDGSNDYISLSSNIPYTNNSITIDAWIRTTSSSGLEDIISWGNTTYGSTITTRVNVVEFRVYNGKLSFVLNDNSLFYEIASTDFVNTGKWIHVAVVKSGTNINLYINGQLANATITGNVAAAPSPNVTNIGVLAYNGGSGYNITGGSYFLGDIDQIRVWNTAKNISDISTNRFVQMSGNESDLVASYDFNQGIANGSNGSLNILNNVNSNTYSGTLNNFNLSGTNSNYVVGFIPEITAAGSATSVALGNTLQLSNGLTGGTWSSSNSSYATVSSSGLVTGVASGSVTITYVICDKTVSYALTVTQPTITTSGILKTFTSCSGCSLNPQNFSVSGSNLGANITLTAPTGLVLSTTYSGTYTSSLTLTQSGGSVTTTSVYVKLSNNSTSINSGIISVTSTGANSKTLTVTVNTDNALHFDGTGDNVTLPASVINGLTNFTFETWVNPSRYTSFQRIFDFGINTSYYMLLTLNNGIPFFAIERNGTYPKVSARTEIPLNTWTHLALVLDASANTATLYINGQAANSGSMSNLTPSSLGTITTAYLGTGFYADPNFQGKMDEVRIWNTARSSSDIASNYLNELVGNETGLVAYYDMNQGVANGNNTGAGLTTLNDKTANSRNGTLNSFALTTGSTSNYSDGFISTNKNSLNASVANNALSFDGANDYVVSNVNGTNLNAFTIEAFINPSNTTQNTKGILQWANVSDPTAGGPMVLFQQNGTQLSVYVNAGYNLTTTLSANTWSHIALSYSNSLYTLYVNGVAVATYAGGISMQSTALQLYLGTGYNGNWNGYMDEVRVWNVSRTSSEINNFMFTDLSGNESGLMAYYNMNQGVSGGTNTSITSLTDKTANAFNATFNNMPLSAGYSSNFVMGNIKVGTSATISAGGTIDLDNSLTNGTWTTSNSAIATVNSNTGLVTGVAAGTVSISYTICGKSIDYSVKVIKPTLTVSGTLKTFTSCSGCNVTPQSFNLSGVDLSNNVLVSAPSGFELSQTSGGVYSSTLTLSSSSVSSGTLSVFVRLVNNAGTTSGGNISITSTGADSKTITTTVNTDNALNFDGSDAINIGQPLSSGSSFTMEAWINYKGSMSENNIISSSSNVFWIYQDKLNGGVASSYQLVTSPNVLEKNRWYHVALTLDDPSDLMKLYIDGILVASRTTSLSFTGGQNSYIGSHFVGGPVSFFNGNIDEVRIWNLVRSDAEIANSMNTELSGTESGLVSYYNFNQGVINGANTSITTLTDAKGRVNGSLSLFNRTGTTSNFVPGFIPSITGNATANVGASSTLSNTLTGGSWSSSNTAIATVNSATGAVTGVAIGTSTITYTICDKTVNTTFTVTVPTITTNGALTAFNTCATTNSAAQTFTVSAQYLSANLVLTAPSGYEIATSSGGTYSSTISIAPTSGSVSARLIYVRTSTSIVNGQSGNITITSTGATTKNIATGNAVVTQNKTASVSITSNAQNNTICSGANITFTASPTNGGLTPTYQWYLNGTSISGATSSTYTTSSLSSNATVTVVMGSSIASCLSGSPATSNAINVTVNNVPNNPGAISGATTICMNSNQVYSISAVTGATSYTWVVTGSLSATSTSTSNIINITAANAAGSGTITVYANNACGTSVSNSTLAVNVNNTPAPTASFTVPANTVCLTSPIVSFTNTSSRNATTNSAINSYSWTFGDGSSANTANASNTYATSGSFDAILTIQDGNSCTSSVSSRIIVDPISVAGTAAAANATICEGANTTLSLVGSTGTIQWQSSTDGINFTNISGAIASNYTTPNLTTTTYYQAVVTSGSCSSVTSGVVTVTVSPTPSATITNITGLLNSSTSFDLAYSNMVGNPNEYSMSSVSPNALPNFTAVNNYGLLGSPITVNIPASASGLYNFNLVLANNTIGCTSNVIPFTVTIAIAAPTSLSYNTPNVYTVGTSITALTPTSSGGAIASYSISPSLPAGLTLNTGTGVISGTPSAVSSQTSYTVTGTNASGTVTATVVITVNDAVGAPVVQTQTEYCVQTQVGEYKYAKVVFSTVKNFSSANSIQVAEWKWFNGNTEISRTGVSVTNPGGSNPGGETPSMIYDGSTSTKWLDFNIKSGSNTSTLLFTFPGSGARIDGYSWITANDSEERDPKSWIVYMSNDNINWTQVHTVSNYTAPTNRFATTTAWSYVNNSSSVTLTATAATGYSLRWYTTATGGTATTTAPTLNTSSATTVTYYVSQFNNAGYESPRAVLSVNVNALPSVPTVITPVNYIVGATATALTATPASGHSLNWYIVSTGGTATSTAFVPSTNTVGTQNYYVSQTNITTGCEGPRTTIAVVTAVAAPAGLSYNTPNVYTVGSTIANLNPSSTGGVITSYSISPSLPGGLTINTTTGLISGTPSAASAQTSYVVTGTNASGSITATVVITVNSGIVPQPQGALNAVDYGLLLSDTVKLKLTTSSGVAPFTLILSNDQTSIKDTIMNLTPVNNEVIFTHKRLDTTKVFTIFKLIDANNASRSSGFTKDTTRVNVLTPKIVLTLKADPAVKQADNSFKTRLLLKVKNAGDLDLRNVQVNANLSKVFPAGINYVLDSIRVLIGNFALNPTYTGAGNAIAASSTESIMTTSNNGVKKSLAILDQNYLLNNGVNLNKNEEGEIAYFISIGATTQNVTLKLQFDAAGNGVLVKNDGSSTAKATSSKSDDGTNINQHPDLTNNGLPLPTYVPLIPNVKIGASLSVSSATPVTGGYQYHFIAKIKNYGNVNLDSLRIQYNFNELFPAPDQASLIGSPSVTRGNIVYNANTYNGYNDVNLFNYGGDLEVGDSATYEYDIKVTTNRTAYTWPNYFVVFGRSTNSGIFVNDTSMSGMNPDPNIDNDPIERVFTNVTINYVPPAPPTVENKTYVYGSVKPTNISGLVKSTPTGSIPVWCDQKTLACSITPPVTPTEIGKYIYALRSYDTTTLLYSEVLVYDTVIIKPPVPLVINKKYIIGNSSNPVNVSIQVTGMSGSVLNYFKNASLQTAIPTLGSIPGVTRYTTSQTVNGIESDTVGFTVTMLDPKTMLHLQKLADEPKLLANSTFNISYTFIVSNKTEDPMTNVLVADNLLNTFPAPTSFDVVSVSSTGGLLFNSGFNGKTDIQLIKPTSTLAAFAIDTIRMTVNLQPKGFNGTVNNVAVVTATTPFGNLNINSSTTGYANETVKMPTPSIIPDLAIDIPEAFSPNRDGVNDRFVILKPFGTTLELEIYNRWGNVVYYNANYNNEWDGRGTNNFIGQDLMDGGYYYTLKTKSINGKSQIFKGFVLIQR
jgi:gliding motility-associated-like protein